MITKISKTKKQIRFLILVFALLLLVSAILVFFLFRCNNSEVCRANPNNPAVSNYNSTGAMNSDNSNSTTNDTNNDNANNIAKNLDGASALLSGTSLVASSGQVINNEGRPVNNEATPMSKEAPKLSVPLDKKFLPDSTIKLEAVPGGFKPESFTVSANKPVTLALTSSGVDSRLVFNDPKLAALELPVPNGYTFAKTFNAPMAPGEYTFYQDIPGRNGETGRMIVK